MRKRRSRHAKAGRITAAAIDAFKAGDAKALHAELRLPPWQVSPLEVTDGPSPWPAQSAGADGWAASQELRKELESAAKGKRP